MPRSINAGEASRRCVQARTRYDPTLKAFRKRLQDAGKPLKVAITACARKLLTILNAIMKNGKDYVKQAA